MQFHHFSSLQNISGLRHAVTTRGGACRDAYDALNLAYHVGDDAARVSENRRALAAELGYDAARLIAAQQPHKTRWRFASESLIGRGAFDWDSALSNADAIILQAPRVPVLIQVADCAPILIVDEMKHTLAVVHAGWRGATQGIVTEVISRMWIRCDVKEEQLKAGIGPCLCLNCFEIGPEVVAAAQKIAPEAVIQHDEWEKPHLDLRLLIQRDLESVGVLRQNIEVMPQCPRCQNDTFFSHRGQNGVAGRFGLVAWWEK